MFTFIFIYAGQAHEVSDRTQAESTDTQTSQTSDESPGLAPSSTSGANAVDRAEQADREGAVLSQLHNINQNEIQAGEMAVKKGESHRVKTYGQQVVEDHSAADQKIMDYVKKHNIILGPAEPQDADQNEAMRNSANALDNLKSLRGTDFDEAFLDAMEVQHSNTIDLIKQVQTDSEDGAFKKFLGDFLPTVKAHHDMAAKLDKKLMQQKGDSK